MKIRWGDRKECQKMQRKDTQTRGGREDKRRNSTGKRARETTYRERESEPSDDFMQKV